MDRIDFGLDRCGRTPLMTAFECNGDRDILLSKAAERGNLSIRIYNYYSLRYVLYISEKAEGLIFYTKYGLAITLPRSLRRIYSINILTVLGVLAAIIITTWILNMLIFIEDFSILLNGWIPENGIRFFK
uniref:Uncharacterized protein n=1 Tax=Gibberella zeae TaxID=5518 RepID=A0A4E9DTQ1_GIBZA